MYPRMLGFKVHLENSEGIVRSDKTSQTRRKFTRNVSIQIWRNECAV